MKPNAFLGDDNVGLVLDNVLAHARDGLLFLFQHRLIAHRDSTIDPRCRAQQTCQSSAFVTSIVVCVFERIIKKEHKSKNYNEAHLTFALFVFQRAERLESKNDDASRERKAQRTSRAK